MSRLLLVAPTLDGHDVGEAWLGYQWASRLAERHELTVLTYSKRGAPSARSQLPGVRVVEWREPPLLGRAERFNSLFKPAYVPFYVAARRWLRQALRAGERFDVAHQVVPVAMRYPSPLAGLGVPYVVGPVGGSLASPPAFVHEEATAPWYVGLRIVDDWRLRHDGRLRRSFQDAACVLAVAPYVLERLETLPLRRVQVMGETGIDRLPPLPDRRGRTGPVRLLFVGRLVRTKGARDALRALAHLRHLDVVLDVVGDGPDRLACEQEARSLGLGDRVTFQGRVPRDRVQAFYAEADVFVFPSYREPGGNVQFEAMASGLPLVVSDRGGPAASVDQRSARLVTPREPAQYARDLADVLQELVLDADLRARMGQAGRERVLQVGLWSSKIDAVERLYADIQG